jgi:uncharacterized protein YycO
MAYTKVIALAMEAVHAITCFDDGNERYTAYVNEWHVVSAWRGKVTLVNAHRPGVRIDSISAWKVTRRDP